MLAWLFLRASQFVSDEECDHVQERALPNMKSSGVSLMDKDKGKKATDWRTSSTYFLPSRSDPILERIDMRVQVSNAMPQLASLITFNDINMISLPSSPRT